MTDLPPNVILFHIVDPQKYPQEYSSFCGEWPPGQSELFERTERPASPEGVQLESRLESWTGFAICANCILSPDYGLWLLGQIGE